MKLYTVYTDSHLPFLKDWFLPSLRDNFDVVIKKRKQLSKTGTYMKDGWIDTMFYKVDLFIETVKDYLPTRGIFIFSDVDIQFFGKVDPILIKQIRGYDLVFQKGGGSVNTGFFLCRASNKTLKFWQDVKKLMHQKHIHEEDGAKILLGLTPEYKDNTNDAFKYSKNKYNIKWKYLPVDKFVGGQYCIKSFKSQILVPPPSTTLMHHATSTTGFENKIRQLKYVKKQMEKHNNIKNT